MNANNDRPKSKFYEEECKADSKPIYGVSAEIKKYIDMQIQMLSQRFQYAFDRFELSLEKIDEINIKLIAMEHYLDQINEEEEILPSK